MQGDASRRSSMPWPTGWPNSIRRPKFFSICVARPVANHSGTPFDIADYFYREICGRESDLHREIHLLAFHYHWSERDILRLTPPQATALPRSVELDIERGAGSSEQFPRQSGASRRRTCGRRSYRALRPCRHASAPARIAAVPDRRQDDLADEAGHGDGTSRRIAPATQPDLSGPARSAPAPLSAISHPARRAREHPENREFRAARRCAASLRAVGRNQRSVRSRRGRQPKPLPALGSAKRTPRTATARDAPSPLPAAGDCPHCSRSADAAAPRQRDRSRRKRQPSRPNRAPAGHGAAAGESRQTLRLPSARREPTAGARREPPRIHVRIGKVEVRASRAGRTAMRGRARRRRSQRVCRAGDWRAHI